MKSGLRLRRSVLSVPAHRGKMFYKAQGLPTDMLMLDLEDSVPEDEKDRARHQLINYFQDLDWRDQVKGYRMNDMGSPFAYRDVIDVVEQVGNKVEVIVIPKVDTADQVKAVDYLLTQIERRMGFDRKIGLEVCIETALGMLKIEEIAFSSSRLETLIFGIADYGASLNMWSKGLSGHGEAEELYPGHRWHFPMSRLNMAAKAARLQAIDAPFGDLRDLDGLKKSCGLSASLGFDGKWVVHPDQIAVVNEMFSPSQEDMERAKKVLAAFDESGDKRSGTASMQGKMLDAASVRLAELVYNKWMQINKK